MPRKKETITLSIPPGTKEQLEAIASRLNILWGERPSVSGLLVAIAQQQLEVGQRFTLTPVQVQSLEQATKVLIDSGYIPEAKTLAALILERGNPEPPLRQSLLQRVSQPMEAWRVQVDRQIENRQPFRLYYQDSQKRDWEFTVRYAEIRFREKRYYLDIWCEETEGNLDLPELIHNWSVRLDRITNLVTFPSEGIWRDGLDYTEVQLHFLGGLAYAYEPRPQEDISDELDGKVRRVVKRVSNTFWLLKDIGSYRAQCIVVSPESLRDRVKQELQSQCEHYGLTTRS
jgi:predicted DNA-binding transcriptional regulator YafY